jgi:hypothetical protein
MIGTGKSKRIFPFLPGRPLNRPCFAKDGKGAPRVRKEGAMRGFVTLQLSIRGSRVKDEMPSDDLIASWIRRGKIEFAAGHCLDLAEYGVNLSAERQTAYYEQGRELCVQIGRLDEFLKTVEKTGKKIKDPLARLTHFKTEGDFFREHGAYPAAADCYLKAEEAAPSSELKNNLIMQAALAYEKLAENAQDEDALLGLKSAIDLYMRINCSESAARCSERYAERVKEDKAREKEVLAASQEAAAGVGLEAGSVPEADEAAPQKIEAIDPRKELLEKMHRVRSIAAGLLSSRDRGKSRGKSRVEGRSEGKHPLVVAFEKLLECGREVESEVGNVAGENADFQLKLAELWRMCGDAGRKIKERGMVAAEEREMVGAYRKAQEILKRLKRDGDAHELNTNIQYARELLSRRSLF